MLDFGYSLGSFVLLGLVVAILVVLVAVLSTHGAAVGAVLDEPVTGPLLLFSLSLSFFFLNFIQIHFSVLSI